MNILVDTSVWSLAFRKKEKTAAEVGVVNLLEELIRDSKTVMIGPIRQEILSGISDQQKFEEMKNSLSVFPDININDSDYEMAANFFNICRSKGIQGSHIDFLICAVAVSHDLTIFTLDNDFLNYKQHLSIKLMR